MATLGATLSRGAKGLFVSAGRARVRTSAPLATLPRSASTAASSSASVLWRGDGERGRRSRGLLSSAAPRRAFSLPAHEVMPMPALSPTMEAGTIAAWKMAEGDAFKDGDVIAEVETDKATVDMVATDDGYLAK